MHTINLKKPLRNLQGKEIVDHQGPILINQVLADILIQGRSSNPAKNMSICLRLHDQGKLELDDSDLEFFKNTVTSCQNATDLLVATVLKEIEEQTKQP